MKKTGCALCLADPTLQDNYDVILTAVKEDGEALQHASDRLRNDFTIACAAYQQNPKTLRYVTNPVLKNALQNL